MVFEARTPEVLDDPPILDDPPSLDELLAERVAEDQHAALFAPEREETSALANVVAGLGHKEGRRERQRVGRGRAKATGQRGTPLVRGLLRGGHARLSLVG